jgi:hypothetical protein
MKKTKYTNLPHLLHLRSPNHRSERTVQSVPEETKKKNKKKQIIKSDHSILVDASRYFPIQVDSKSIFFQDETALKTEKIFYFIFYFNETVY